MKKILVIMGTHPNSQKTFDWTRKDCDVWLFNEAPNLKTDEGKLKFPKCDACFQLHHQALWKNPKNLSDPNHYAWLSSGNTPHIYMQEKFPDVPKSIKYPLKRVSGYLKNTKVVINGNKKNIMCFSSSPDFAFALVADMWKRGQKYEKVEVHGIEMEMESEYRFQRTGFAFWIGFLTALGINIVIYNSIFNEPMYGYEGDVIIPSAEFEKRITDLTRQLSTGKEDYTQQAKEFIDNLSSLMNQDTSLTVRKIFRDVIRLGEIAGMASGRIKENERYLEKAKAMEKAVGTSVFAAGEFDNARSSYSTQFNQVRNEVFNFTTQIDPYLKKVTNLKKGSQKRQKAIHEFGKMMAENLNKNILLFHIAGAIEESKYYLNLVKQSYMVAMEKLNKHGN